MYILRLIFSILLLVGVTLSAAAQDNPQNSILLTGVMLDSESREALPYVNIQVANTIYGTASGTNGQFSIFISPGDTLLFSYVGYVDARFIMPLELNTHNYSLIQLMRQKTTVLEEILVFPWPTMDSFKQAFLDVEPNPDMNNLIREVQASTVREVHENQLTEYEADQRRYQRLYEIHQIFPPNNFLNPVRWNQFIREITDNKD
jgi:hypothetical protein